MYAFIKKCINSYNILKTTIKFEEYQQLSENECDTIIITRKQESAQETDILVEEDCTRDTNESDSISHLEVEYLDDQSSNIEECNASYDSIIETNSNESDFNENLNYSNPKNDPMVVEILEYNQNLSNKTDRVTADMLKFQKESTENKCELCMLTFETINLLIKHGMEHIDSNQKHKSKYLCHICLKTLSSFSAYTNHMEVHTENTYTCNICQEKFNTKFRYTSHMILHNPDYTTTFKCPQCPKIYLKQSLLDRHILIHTGDKPFKCKICDYSARVKENLKVCSLALYFKCITVFYSFKLLG